MSKNDAKIIAVIGASGTGKSSFIKGELLRKQKKLLVWSPLERTDNYAGFSGGVGITGQISKFIEAIKGKATAVVYTPVGNDASMKKQFDLFCRVAWELEGWTILVEELSRVTMPSWAPPAWKNLSTAGRHQGLTIIGTSQRPAQIDKDFLGNCTEIRCYRVNYDSDSKVMGDALGLQTEWTTQNKRTVGIKPQQQIRALPNFHFFHRNPDLSIRRGMNKPL